MSKKIFFVGRYVPYTVSLFSQLQKIITNNDIQIEFLGPDEKNAHWLSYQKIEGTKLVWSYGDYFRRIYSYVKLNKPDVIHLSFELRTYGSIKSTIFFPLLLYLISKTKSKIIVTIHNVLLTKKENRWRITEDLPIKIPKPILRFLIKKFIQSICSSSNKIIVEAEESKDGLVHYYKIDEEKIHVIHIGISTSNQPINFEKKKKYDDLFKDKKIILMFGMISSRKGQEYAIRSFKLIHKKFPDYLLVIAGKVTKGYSWYEKKLQKLVKELELENGVMFLGFVDDDQVEILFEMADISLFLYSHMAGGTAALPYAIQHEVPSIVTDSETFREILGRSGAIYVKPELINDLSQSIEKLIKNPSLAEELIQEMKIVKAKFSLENSAEAHLAVYTKLMIT